ncbi:phosphoglycerate dehydrogenase [Nitrospina gracilis]|uniref:phosphoglycerate dehydrogenase n=1 Tax=Nitrospina gracilis TaxID=35801 RepID=UPI001F31600A|nr:phosphoglycerate dehydrogenase [Nitrospina gracilis]MCF8720180.1 D-3-phosphoglycerate dehydrogenase [Nitrospina gracilis Nb-211]
MVAEKPARVAVTPPAVCKSPVLREVIAGLFPDARFNDTGQYLTEDQLIAFSEGAEALLIGRDPLTERVLAALPGLRLVAKYGVGLDNLDIPAMERCGVRLGWTAGVNRRSAAELTMTFILGLCHNVFASGNALKQGRWEKDGGVVLEGKTVGVIGCGHIGSDVVRLLQPFACRILVRDILNKHPFCAEMGAQQVEFDTVIRESDIVTLHIPLTDQTRNMIDARAFGEMKPSAFLVNTSRGEVVDEQVLKRALITGTIAGAALDVFAQEPPEDDELLACPNLFATPHIGGNAKEAVEAMARSAISHIVDYFKK